ncbi:MAG: competence protein CoiA family protein [Cytophagales bacterium]|nr:competence protein CoiA family protein [Cytophagales bacterium]
MRIALINNERSEAQPGQKGICPVCDQTVIAKCGDKKVWHWAHQSLASCDKWWESETEWHRKWKNNYPVECQEVILLDKDTGDKHIADVRTKHNLVIEFQHSSIKKEERISREEFYKNMVWLVDGTRLKNDYLRFLKGKNSIFFNELETKNVYQLEFPDQVFPSNWIDSSVPVIFDFLGLETANNDELRGYLWCLLPGTKNKTFVVRLIREYFIYITNNSPTLFKSQTKTNFSKAVHAKQPSYYLDKKGKFRKRWRF